MAPRGFCYSVDGLVRVPGEAHDQIDRLVTEDTLQCDDGIELFQCAPRTGYKLSPHIQVHVAAARVIVGARAEEPHA